MSESHIPRRGLRASLARRVGRFLGVSDLLTSVHELQARSAALAREIDALGDQAAASNAQVRQLTERFDGLVKGESDLQLAVAVWITSTYLAHTPVPEHELISVIVATRNRTALVQRAIASVIAQSYSNWELIVVDDGSDDGSSETLNALAEPRIRFVWQEQGGPAAARNKGLGEARGEYVVYLDDDNVMYPHWLRGVAWAFDQHPDAEVMVGARIIDDERRNQGLGRGGWPQLALPWFDRERIAQESVADIIQLAHRRDLPEACFDEQLRGTEDWDLLARLTRDRDPLVFPALAGIYSTSAFGRLMDTDLLAREALRVREKIVAIRRGADDLSDPG